MMPIFYDLMIYGLLFSGFITITQKFINFVIYHSPNSNL